MSLSLTLIFENVPNFGDHGRHVLGHDRLHYGGFSRDRQEALAALATPLGRPLYVYEDGGLRATSEDPYGTPLTFITAHMLWRSKLLRHSDTRPWDNAIDEFVRLLPPDTRIILWWS